MFVGSSSPVELRFGGGMGDDEATTAKKKVSSLNTHDGTNFESLV
jgi:hypothetical protein